MGVLVPEGILQTIRNCIIARKDECTMPAFHCHLVQTVLGKARYRENCAKPDGIEQLASCTLSSDL